MRPGKGEEKPTVERVLEQGEYPVQTSRGNGTEGEGGKRRAASKREGDKQEGNGAGAL